MENAPLIRGVGLTKTFGGAPALIDATVGLLPGEVHAFVGENGAGKSTLAKLLAGVYAPTLGTIEVGGESVRFAGPRDAHAKGIALIPQEPQTFPDLTVAENLFLGRQPRKGGFVDWKTMNAEAARWLEQVGASLDPKATVRGLSVADRQLIELATALSQNARILFLDETTASLTPSEVERLAGIIRKLQDDGCALAFVSHRTEEVFSLCDRLTVLRDGKVVGEKRVPDTTPQEVLSLMVGREFHEPALRAPRAESAEVAPKLEIRNLTRRRKFTDVSLHVRAGEIVALAGLVGAGRTEVARALFGLLPIDSGEILLDGKPVKIPDPRAAQKNGLALVPEDRQKQGALLPWSIWQNASLAFLCSPRPAGAGVFLTPSKERELATEWAGRLAVKCESVEQSIGELSGGNQQKVVFGKWLATDPQILILDEPTRGVDVGAKARIHEEISALASKGVAVLLISSDLPEVLALADRVYVLRAGSLAGEFSRETATPEAIIAAAAGISA